MVLDASVAVATKVTPEEVKQGQESVMAFIAKNGSCIDLNKKDNDSFVDKPLIKLIQEAINQDIRDTKPKDEEGNPLKEITVDGILHPGGDTAKAIMAFQKRKGLGNQATAGINTLTALDQCDHNHRILGGVEKLVGAENMPIVRDLLSGLPEKVLGFDRKDQSAKQLNALLETLLPGVAETIRINGEPSGIKSFTECVRIGDGTYQGLAMLCSKYRKDMENHQPIGPNVMSDIITGLADREKNPGKNPIFPLKPE